MGKLIVVSDKTKSALDARKKVTCETYDSVVQRLLEK